MRHLTGESSLELGPSEVLAKPSKVSPPSQEQSSNVEQGKKKRRHTIGGIFNRNRQQQLLTNTDNNNEQQSSSSSSRKTPTKQQQQQQSNNKTAKTTTSNKPVATAVPFCSTTASSSTSSTFSFETTTTPNSTGASTSSSPASSPSSNPSSPSPASFKNFNDFKFDKQCDLVVHWFHSLQNHPSRQNHLLEMLQQKQQKQQQKEKKMTEEEQLIMTKSFEEEEDYHEEEVDWFSCLPKLLVHKVLGYLDPQSLGRACRVTHAWHSLINSDELMWKQLCSESRWRFSPQFEAKQLQQEQTKKITWKENFVERYRVKMNWLQGRSKVKTFEGHDGAVSCVQFDEKRIVAGSSLGNLSVWSLLPISNSSINCNCNSSSFPEKQPYLKLFGHSGTIRCLHLDGELDLLYSGSADHSIKVWDLSEVHATWSRVTCKMTFCGHADTVRCLTVRGPTMISGSYDNTLKIWKAASVSVSSERGAAETTKTSSSLTLRGHTDSVLCVEFDESKIISGSADRTIRLWHLLSGECFAQLAGHTGAVTCLHFDEERIVSGSLDFDIKLWCLRTRACVNTLNWITKEGHTAAIRCLKADNQKIVSCSDDKTIKIWNIETGERYVTLKNHSDGVTCLQFNDFYILSGSYDRTIKLWDFSIV